MKNIKKVLNDWLTGIDGKTMDPARGLWFAGIIAFLCFTGHEVYKSDKFDMVNFAMAYSALLAAGAASVKIKESTEPAAPTPRPAPKSAVTVVVNNDDDDEVSLKPPKG